MQKIVLYIAAMIMVGSAAGCIGEMHITSPVPRTTIRGADGSYIVIAPKEVHIEWATTWPFPYPYGDQSKGGK